MDNTIVLNMSKSLAELQAELNKITGKSPAKAKREFKGLPPFECRVAPKGGVSVYGLQYFPVTLYPDQWRQVFERMTEINSFIATNSQKLESIKVERTAVKALKKQIRTLKAASK